MDRSHLLGAIGILIKAVTTVLIYRMQRNSVNIRALFLHNLSDALASSAVVIGGTLRGGSVGLHSGRGILCAPKIAVPQGQNRQHQQV